GVEVAARPEGSGLEAGAREGAGRVRLGDRGQGRVDLKNVAGAEVGHVNVPSRIERQSLRVVQGRVHGGVALGQRRRGVLVIQENLVAAGGHVKVALVGVQAAGEAGKADAILVDADTRRLV